MKTTNNHLSIKQTLLASALAALIAPGMALADGHKTMNATHGTDAKAAHSVDDDENASKSMPLSAAHRDAYREGQIWATYVTNPGLNALDLTVDVNGNKAIVSGTVETAIQKRLAGLIAGHADGIAAVENRIIVDPLLVVTVVTPAPGYASFVADATLAAMVDSKLLWNQYTDGLDIDVEAAGSVVTLSGIADTPSSRTLAGWLAANTPGVTLVHNKLTLDPEHNGQVATAKASDGDDLLSDLWITAKTRTTLLWTDGVQGTNIDVETQYGVVMLNGTVESGYEKELAIEIAQGIRGVQRVDASGLEMKYSNDSISQR